MAQGRVYTVIFDNVAVTAAQDFFALRPAAGKPIRLLAIDIGQTNRVGDANEDMLRWEIKVFTGATLTAGTGGTAPTPQVVHATDQAAGFTSRVNDTTRASTTGTTSVKHASTFNTRVGLLWVPPPEVLIECADSTNGDLIVGTAEAVSASTTMSGTAYVEELG